MKNKRGRNPLPSGWKRVYFNASPDAVAYFHEARRAQKLATRADMLRLITDEARSTRRFLTSIDANLATEPQP